jgi:hypothetical protein
MASFLENMLLAFPQHPPANLQSQRLRNYGEVYPDLYWGLICYITINYLALISGIPDRVIQLSKNTYPSKPRHTTKYHLSHALRQQHVSQTVGSTSSTPVRAPHIRAAAPDVPHNPHNLPTPRSFPIFTPQFHPQHHPKTTPSTTRR